MVTASLRYVGLFFAAVVFSLAAIGYFSLRGGHELIFRIHLKFAGDLISVAQFIEKVIYLDASHGGVSKIQRALFLVPLVIVLFWLVEGGLRKLTPKDDVHEGNTLAIDQHLVILSIFSLGIWLTIFRLGRTNTFGTRQCSPF